MSIDEVAQQITDSIATAPTANEAEAWARCLQFVVSSISIAANTKEVEARVNAQGK